MLKRIGYTKAVIKQTLYNWKINHYFHNFFAIKWLKLQIYWACSRWSKKHNSPGTADNRVNVTLYWSGRPITALAICKMGLCSLVFSDFWTTYVRWYFAIPFDYAYKHYTADLNKWLMNEEGLPGGR